MSRLGERWRECSESAIYTPQLQQGKQTQFRPTPSKPLQKGSVLRVWCFLPSQWAHNLGRNPLVRIMFVCWDVERRKSWPVYLNRLLLSRPFPKGTPNVNNEALVFEFL